MGRLQAEEMIQLTDLDTALRWHLGHNHYPPLPESLLPVAKLAISLASKPGNWNVELELPDGIKYRNKTFAPVRACVEEWHLDSFISVEGDD